MLSLLPDQIKKKKKNFGNVTLCIVSDLKQLLHVSQKSTIFSSTAIYCSLTCFNMLYKFELHYHTC